MRLKNCQSDYKPCSLYSLLYIIPWTFIICAGHKGCSERMDYMKYRLLLAKPTAQLHVCLPRWYIFRNNVIHLDTFLLIRYNIPVRTWHKSPFVTNTISFQREKRRVINTWQELSPAAITFCLSRKGRNDNQGLPPSPYWSSEALSIAAFNVLSQ